MPTASTSLAFVKDPEAGVDITVDNIGSIVYFFVSHGYPLDSILTFTQYVAAPPLLRAHCGPSSDSSAKDFGHGLHRCLAALTEHAHRAHQRTVLYVPVAEALDDPAAIAADRNAVQRLESVVAHWTRQIRDVLAEKDGTSGMAATDDGPLAEIAFWKRRAADLASIVSQLQRDDVQRIVTTLELAKADYSVDPFRRLSNDIEAGSAEAVDNVKNLKTLIVPCTALASEPVVKLDSLLMPIAQRVLMIFLHSAYYNTPERVVGLLRRVSREIVTRCCASIDVNAVWEGRVDGPMKAIEDAVALCDKWRTTCTQLLDGCVSRWERQHRRAWHVDTAAVFAEVDAFSSQRCKDLLEVCGGQLQFRRHVLNVEPTPTEGEEGGAAPQQQQQLVFGGAKGPELMATLAEMHTTFKKLLDDLWQHKAMILDVKAAQWHDHFQVFRAGLKDLEGVMSNAISNAFETVPNVTAGTELVDAFEGLAKRSSLRRALDAKVRDVFALFLKEVNAVKSTFNENRRNPPLPLHHPPMAGRVAWAMSLRNYLERLSSTLTFADGLSDCPEKSEASSTHSLVHQRLEQYMQQTYDEWRNSLLEQPSELLAVPVIVRTVDPNGVSLLQVNFSPQLLILLKEAKMWRQLGHALPTILLPLVDVSEKLLVLRATVAQAVREYNDIILSLTESERPLFAAQVAALDKRVAHGLLRVLWNAKGVAELYVRPLRRHCADVREVADAFHAGVAVIRRACRQISNTSLVSLERKMIYTESVFEQRQREHRESSQQHLIAAHTQIVQTMHAVFKQFCHDGDAIAVQWEQFVQSVELDVDAALRQTVKRSLQELMRAFVEGRSESSPLFLVEVTLVGLRPELRPTIVELSQTISTVSRDLIGVVGVIPRLPEALVALDEAEDRAKEGLPLSASAPKPGTEAAAQRAIRLGRGVEEQQDLMPFHEVMANDNEVIRVMAAITEGMSAVQEHVQEFLTRFDEYSEIYNSDRAAWMKRFEKQGVPLGGVEVEIKKYRDLTQKVSAEESAASLRFVRLDCSKLKRELAEHCSMWQRDLFDVLNATARKELNELYSHFTSVTKQLRATPQTIEHLAELLNLLQQVHASHGQTEARFEPLRARYALLDRYEQTVQESELERLATLPQVWEDFESTIRDSKRRLERLKDQFRVDLEADCQTFERSAAALGEEFTAMDPFAAHHTPADAQALISAFKQRLLGLQQKEQGLRDGLAVFDIAKGSSNEMVELEERLQSLETIWKLNEEWQDLWSQWTTEPFRSLDINALNDATSRFTRLLGKLGKTLGSQQIFLHLKDEVDRFRRTLPLLQHILNPAMRDRHWQRLKDELNLPQFDHNAPTFVMGDVTNLQLEQYPEFIANLSTSASAELAIDNGLTTIKEHWEGAELTLERIRGDLFKVTGTDDLFTAVEEHSVQLSSFKLSRFVEPFEREVTQWEHNLSLIADVVETLLSVQVRWLYLEAIFNGSEDIQKQLQQETSLFAAANATWTSIMSRIHGDPNLLRQSRKEGLVETLQDLIRRFEKIQKLLEDYLETRRRAFPRFYFLSNDDILEILGRAREPARVQPHLKKCFEGLTKLELKSERTVATLGKEGPLHATTLYGPDGEAVPLLQSVLVEGVAVESWLGHVEEQMRASMKLGVVRCFHDLRKKRPTDQWVRSHSGQALITASQLNWTLEVERALSDLHAATTPGPDGQLAPAPRRNPLKHALKKWKAAVQQYCTLIRSSSLDRMNRNKLIALITIQVHARDILDKLFAAKVSSPYAFDWVSQLRFYWTDPQSAGVTGGGTTAAAHAHNGTCVVRQTSAEISYDFEYVGNSGRLVITPLTDRCYMTLTTALQLSRGGQPQGPAGTGKTETVKDLGKAIAKYVIVFNCSEGLDYESLGRMFAGLVQSGAWSCFDEFNRIEVEVLSVVAQQIFTILSAIFLKKSSFVFGSRGEIPLHRGCGIFVTMNPGYAGRSELPDNLKALLRPISMMVPDNALICEIILLSQGFSNSTSLARKVALMYSLMNQQLSKQSHYDFGLRAVKSVLVRAGNLKRMAFQRAAATVASHLTPQQRSEEEANPASPLGRAVAELQSQPVEEVLVWRACADMNLPRFVADDVPLFMYILKDLFPSVERPSTEAVALLLREGLTEELQAQGLQPTEHVLFKGVQLFETKRTRHGVMVVGETLTGKTETWKAVAGAMRRLAAAETTKGGTASKDDEKVFESVRAHLINPKSISNDELYGIYNLQTREWKDGILSSVMRNICASETPEQKWVVFDGPVDTLWVESMNTLLDDNKLLTLNSGERIALPPQVSLLFECQDLKVASPATVSRCGMVYFAADDLGYDLFVQSWLSRRFEVEKQMSAPEPQATFEFLQGLFANVLPKALAVRAKDCEEVVPQADLQCVRNLCRLFDALAVPISEATGFGGFCSGVSTLDSDPAQYRNILQMYFFFALTWAVGGNVTAESRRRFDHLVRELEPSIPSTDTVYEYFVDPKAATWRHFESHLGAWSPEPDVPLAGQIVPTTDTLRYSALVTILLRGRHHVIVQGDSGIGKTTMLNRAISSLDEQYAVFTTIFSARTSSLKVQETIEGKLDKKSKKSYAPPAGRRLVAIIEDVNLPNRDTFGSQPPLELLRQWMDCGSWYDREAQTKRSIGGVQLVGVMSHGRQQLPSRFYSKFSPINLTFPSESTLRAVFSQLLDAALVGKDDLLGLTETIVAATLDVHKVVSSAMRPTPSKPHYLFNLRHLAAVVTGLLNANPSQTVENRDQLIVLWLHETQRVYGDRLSGAKDQNAFRTLMTEKLQSNFSAKWSALLKDARNPMFVDFFNLTDRFDENRVYREIGHTKELKKSLEAALDAYNSEPGVRPLSLVFFHDAMAHLCRVYKLIRAPRGHALLVGIGGSGRSSLARLAAYIAGYNLFEIEVTKSYGLNEFHEDLKRLYIQCGKKQQSTVFLLTEQQLIGGEVFLEEVNSILGAGEVPNLFTPQELNELREELRTEALSSGILHDTVENVYSFFLNRAKDHLHLVLCVSPVGRQFRDRVRMFPALVAATGVDWYSAWPNDALQEVAERELEDIDLGEPERVSAITNALVQVHAQAVAAADRMSSSVGRIVYLAPMHYIEFVRGYRKFLKAKRSEFGEHENKLRGGLDKLSSTKAQVQRMSVDLEQQRKHLAQATQDCEALLSVMRHEKRVADEKRIQIESDKAKVQRESEHATQIAAEAQAELNLAMPALLEAEAALETLNRNDLDEIRVYSTPPDVIKLVMAAVQTTLKRPPSWDEARRTLGDNLLKTLLEYDRERMLTDAMLNKMQTYVQNPRFDPEIVGRVSTAAKGLCLWVIAMHRYGRIQKEVLPKKLKQKRAMDEVERKQRALEHAVASLDAIVEKVKELEGQTQAKLAEKDLHQKSAEATEAKLKRAEILVSGLGSERDRWTSSIDSYQQRAVALLGDSVLASGFLSYLAPFTSQFRAELQSSWTRLLTAANIPMSQSTSATSLLVEPTVLRDWHKYGLPGDDFSCENGVLVMKSERWPLMIDPQGQAARWIKAMEGPGGVRSQSNLRVVDARGSSTEYVRVLESAIVNGHTVLMQDVSEDLDPILEPILSRAVVSVASRLMIKVGDNSIDYNPDFRFYMTTKLSNPHYTPEIFSKVNVVNFAVKEQGLEEQLLKLVVRHEKPELEEAKDMLVVSVGEAKKATKELEDRILRLLAEADDNLLDDPNLLDTLQTSKTNAAKIANQLRDDEATDEKISQAREQYRAVARRASVLYFVLCDLARMDTMYQFSLDAYVLLFQNSITKSSDNVRTDNVPSRVKSLNEWHTLATYQNTCRALRECHKLTFAFHMAGRILAADGSVSPDEFAFFVRGGVVLDPEALPPNPCTQWLPPKAWESVSELDKLPAFHGLAASIEAAANDWKTFFLDPEPETAHLPEDWSTRLESFQHMVLVRCLRPDRVLVLGRAFVERHLGRRYTVSPPLILDDLVTDSAPTLPIIFILSAGVDPTEQLQQLAQKHNKQLYPLALGQGQGPAALRLIQEQMRVGGWVFLANCHLMSSWLGQLEKVIEELPSQRPVEGFRLWLSSAPVDNFPIWVLQSSLKITTEPPRGLRANMLRMFNNLNETTFNACSHPVYYRGLMWGLVFFHAVLIERRKFGTLGLNVPYDFNDSDFAVAEQLLRIYLDDLPDDARPDQVPFATLRYLIAEATYGGRVTDDWDSRLIKTYMSDVLCDSAIRDGELFHIAPGVDAFVCPFLDGSLEQYREVAAQLPVEDPAEAFGQHPNADVSSQIQESSQLLQTIMLLNREVLAAAAAAAARRDGREGDDALGGKKKSDDEEGVGGHAARVLEIASDIRERLPDPIDYNAVLEAKAEDMGNALTTVLLQETLRYNVLLRTVAAELAQLMDGVKGLRVMDVRLDAAFQALQGNSVPDSWSVAYPSTKPLASWVRDLIERIEQVSTWGVSQPPRVFWLGGLTYPTGFLKALQQQAARRSGMAIDSFSWAHHVLSREDRATTTSLADGRGALVRGLVLEGAGWSDEASALQDPAPMELLVPMPIIHFEPVDASKKTPSSTAYNCPLYMYPVRTGTRERPSFVTTVELSSGAYKPSRWIKRGAALLLSTAD